MEERGLRESEGMEGGEERLWTRGGRGGEAGLGWASPAGPHPAGTPQNPVYVPPATQNHHMVPSFHHHISLEVEFNINGVSHLTSQGPRGRARCGRGNAWWGQVKRRAVVNG